MKSLLRTTIYYAVTLAILPIFLSGIIVTGGFWTYILAGFVLTILYYIIKPVVGIISFPLTIISTGLFTFLINLLILYLMTIFIPQVDIGKSTLHGFSFWGIIVSSIVLNRFLAYIICSVIVTVCMGCMRWLNE